MKEDKEKEDKKTENFLQIKKCFFLSFKKKKNKKKKT